MNARAPFSLPSSTYALFVKDAAAPSQLRMATPGDFGAPSTQLPYALQSQFLSLRGDAGHRLGLLLEKVGRVMSLAATYALPSQPPCSTFNSHCVSSES